METLGDLKWDTEKHHWHAEGKVLPLLGGETNHSLEYSFMMFNWQSDSKKRSGSLRQMLYFNKKEIDQLAKKRRWGSPWYKCQWIQSMTTQLNIFCHCVIQREIFTIRIVLVSYKISDFISFSMLELSSQTIDKRTEFSENLRMI